MINTLKDHTHQSNSVRKSPCDVAKMGDWNFRYDYSSNHDPLIDSKVRFLLIVSCRWSICQSVGPQCNAQVEKYENECFRMHFGYVCLDGGGCRLWMGGGL